MRKANKITLYIDFDDTIRDKEGLPMVDAQPMLLKLKRNGYKIVIFSARAAHPDLIGPMEDWLKIHKIPFDKITNIKGEADYYIDNKAVRFTSWAQVMEEVWKPA